MNRKSKAVLVYHLGSLGDTVIAIPALKAVRRHYGSGVHIAVLHESRQKDVVSPAEILEGLGLVNEYIGYKRFENSFTQWTHAAALLGKLALRRFDAAIYLLPSERTAAQVERDVLFFRLSGAKHRIGFYSFSPETIYPVDSDGLPAKVPHEAWFRLERLRLGNIDVSRESDLTKPFLAPPMSSRCQARQWLATHRQEPLLPLVAINPGAKNPANLWSIERFIEIGKRLVQQAKAEVIVIGGPGDDAMAGQQMIEAWGGGLNAAGNFSVLGSASLMAECALVVGLDTGTTHLAAAQGIPCVALYSCHNWPGRFYPLGAQHIVLRHNVPCSGCRLIEQPCPLAEHPCMMGISVDRVWEAIRCLMS